MLRYAAMSTDAGRNLVTSSMYTSRISEEVMRRDRALQCKYLVGDKFYTSQICPSTEKRPPTIGTSSGLTWFDSTVSRPNPDCQLAVAPWRY